MYHNFIKRPFDIIVSMLLLIIASPLLLILISILFFENKGQVFFIQNRAGWKGEIFSIIKFKSMKDTKDLYGELLPDKQRLTAFGKFLRKTSLDELPQLLNVLKGDLSLVGPRPLLLEYTPFYNTQQKKRLEVKPGITGYAQVNGRNSISWEDKFKLDIYYVENLCFLLDAKILFKTAIKILSTDGVNSSAEFSMEKFQGSKI